MKHRRFKRIELLAVVPIMGTTKKCAVCCLLTVLALGLALCGRASAQGSFPYTAHKAATPPTIDGVIDSGEWLTQEQVVNEETMDAGGSYCVDPGENRDAYSARVYYMWDDDFFYAAVDVTDGDVVCNAASGAANNNTDIFHPTTDHMFLREGGPATPGIYIHGVAPCTSNDDGTGYYQFWNGEDGREPFTNAVFASSFTDTGYQVELALPWSDFQPNPPMPEPGFQMGYLTVLLDFGADGLLRVWSASGGGCAGIGDAATYEVMTFAAELVLQLSVSILGPSRITIGQEVFLMANDNNAVGIVNFQWYLDGVELSGETGPVLSIGPVTELDEGVYSVTVKDDENEASASFSLMVVAQLPAANWYLLLLAVAAITVLGGGIALRLRFS